MKGSSSTTEASYMAIEIRKCVEPKDALPDDEKQCAENPHLDDYISRTIFLSFAGVDWIDFEKRGKDDKGKLIKPVYQDFEKYIRNVLDPKR